MISKYVAHLPVYRQRQQVKRYGIELAEATRYDGIKAPADVIMPLVELRRQRLLQAHYLMVDETPIHVLDREKPGTTHQGYYWVYYDPLDREAFFDYQKSRSRDGPNTQLKDFSGDLQSDGYSGYDEAAARAGSLWLTEWPMRAVILSRLPTVIRSGQTRCFFTCKRSMTYNVMRAPTRYRSKSATIASK